MLGRCRAQPAPGDLKTDHHTRCASIKVAQINMRLKESTDGLPCVQNVVNLTPICTMQMNRNSKGDTRGVQVTS